MSVSQCVTLSFPLILKRTIRPIKLIFGVSIGDQGKVPFANWSDPISKMAATADILNLVSAHFKENHSSDQIGFWCEHWGSLEEGSFCKMVRSDIQDGRHSRHIEFDFRSF